MKTSSEQLLEDGRRIVAARVFAGLSQGDLAEILHKSRQSVSAWENGRASVPPLEREAVARALGKKVHDIWPTANGQRERVVPRGTAAIIEAGWPRGWNARAYRLQLEAAEAGATEEEIAAVRGWMLDPQVQAMWSGGAPKTDQLKSLDGIEIGARAWLRARGRMVKAR